MRKLAKRGSQAMLGLYIAAVLAAESSSGCPSPCGAVCLELIDHKDCRGSPCSQQELEFGDLCTGDATCGDAGRCYVAAAETEANVLAATTRRRARRDEASLRRLAEYQARETRASRVALAVMAVSVAAVALAYVF